MLHQVPNSSAAEPGDEIRGAHVSLQQCSHVGKQPVAGAVAAGVVDHLELSKVHVQQGRACPPVARRPARRSAGGLSNSRRLISRSGHRGWPGRKRALQAPLLGDVAKTPPPRRRCGRPDRGIGAAEFWMAMSWPRRLTSTLVLAKIYEPVLAQAAQQRIFNLLVRDLVPQRSTVMMVSPWASAPRQPDSCSATGFRYSIRLPGPVVMTASPIDCKVTWARSFSSNIACSSRFCAR